MLTLFARLRAALSAGEDTSPETSPVFSIGQNALRYNVQYYKRESITLNNSATHSIQLPNHVQASKVIFLARITGSDISTAGKCSLDTEGVDVDDSTPISGRTFGYGIDAHPGVIGLCSYNVDTFTLTGLADGTKVTYILAVIADDSEL